MTNQTQNPKAVTSSVSSDAPNFALCSTSPDACDRHRHIISPETVTCMGCQSIFADTWRMHQMPCGICFLCPVCLPKVALQPSRRMTRPAVVESVQSLIAASKAMRDQALESGARSTEQRRALMASANQMDNIARSEAGLTCRCGSDLRLTTNFLSCLRKGDAQLFWDVEQQVKRLCAQ